jgi:hypothetical protein
VKLNSRVDGVDRQVFTVSLIVSMVGRYNVVSPDSKRAENAVRVSHGYCTRR